MKKVILSGQTGTGKTTRLINEYERVINEEGIKSEQILVLLMNRNQSLDWRKKNNLNVSGRILRTSFFGFVQEEISTYYPIILKKVPEIKERTIKPVFLTFETSQYLLSMLIEKRRNNVNSFLNLIDKDSRIAIDISSNFVKAAAAALSYKDIGHRLYSALEIKNEDKRLIFEEADKIIEDYRTRCLECGVMDFAMAVDFYNNILLKDEGYLKSLKSRIKYLIVDNLEEAVPMQINLIVELIDSIDGCMMAYNPDGGYGSIFGANKEYVEETLLSKCSVTNISEKPYTCNKYMVEFSDSLFDGIVKKSDEKLKPNGIDFTRMPETVLRSDMLDDVAIKVKELVVQGYKPQDIAIVSTFADVVTEYVLESRLRASNIKVTNIARKSRFIDNKFVYALITLAYLCHPSEEIIPTKDDVRALISMILDIDPIRSSMLADVVCSQNPFAMFPEVSKDVISRIGYSNVEKYNFIREWINNYREGEPLEMNIFFERVFIEILLSYGANEEDIIDIKRLIDSASNFIGAVKRFNTLDVNRGFLKMIKNGVKSAESIFDMEERGESDEVILCTPMAYLSNSLTHKVIILIGLSSNHWTPKCAKELSNPYVLTSTWKMSDIYTEEIEEENQKKNIAIMLRALIKRCGEKFITFESRYSSDGFENDGILTELF